MNQIENIALPTVGLIVVKNNKLLLAYSKNKKAWYLPGGKVKKGETSKESLIREISEELNIAIVESQLNYFAHVTAPAWGENANIIMEQDCFLHELNEKIVASHEITAVKYFDLIMYREELAQVPGVLKVFELLFEAKKLYFN